MRRAVRSDARQLAIALEQLLGALRRIAHRVHVDRAADDAAGQRVNRLRAIAEAAILLQLVGGEARDVLRRRETPRPDFVARPHFSTSSSVIRTVCRHIVFVVVMIFTTSSKSVAPQSSRPNPDDSTQACVGELRESATNSLSVDAELEHARRACAEARRVFSRAVDFAARRRRTRSPDRPASRRGSRGRCSVCSSRAQRNGASRYQPCETTVASEVEVGRSGEWRRRPGSNRRIEVLQTSALPLGYVAPRRRLASVVNRPGSVNIRSVDTLARVGHHAAPRVDDSVV